MDPVGEDLEAAASEEAVALAEAEGLAAPDSEDRADRDARIFTAASGGASALVIMAVAVALADYSAC